jgi:low affinity Fe/Cu permease
VSPALWIALGVAITVVLCYVLGMRVLVRKSRDIDQQVDTSRIRPWKGDEGQD